MSLSCSKLLRTQRIDRACIPWAHGRQDLETVSPVGRELVSIWWSVVRWEIWRGVLMAFSGAVIECSTYICNASLGEDSVTYPWESTVAYSSLATPVLRSLGFLLFALSSKRMSSQIPRLRPINLTCQRSHQRSAIDWESRPWAWRPFGQTGVKRLSLPALLNVFERLENTAGGYIRDPDTLNGNIRILEGSHRKWPVDGFYFEARVLMACATLAQRILDKNFFMQGISNSHNWTFQCQTKTAPENES